MLTVLPCFSRLAPEVVTASECADVEFQPAAPPRSPSITLKALSAKYPDHQFTVLIGADNWLCFDRWRAADEIIANYGVTVYPRPRERL